MAKAVDDLDAVRQLADILQPFTESERERIIRWALERLGMSSAAATPTGIVPQISATPAQPGPLAASDIKSFVVSKDPKTDAHLAAVVAYYYRFVSPEKKESITKDDFVDACRKAERRRPPRPAQTLVNAYTSGLFDKSGHGSYKINSVGENLVAMVLPGKPEASNRKSSIKRPLRKRSGKTNKRQEPSSKNRK